MMIGDQLEAKARVFLPQTRDECVALVRDTVARVTADQQLVYAGLTTEDLEKMEAAFADVLHAIHHRRLGYGIERRPDAVRGWRCGPNGRRRATADDEMR